MTGRSKASLDASIATVFWNVERGPKSGRNCLGRLSRDSGHIRVPDPPHMMTGSIFAMASSRSEKSAAKKARAIARQFTLECVSKS
jgi:hypothetical protein